MHRGRSLIKCPISNRSIMRTVNTLEATFITEVSSKAQEQIFLDMPTLIYQDDPHYVRPLDQDIKDIFDAQTNSLLIEGDCRRWLLWTKAGICIGRIAAFYKVKQRIGTADPQRRIGGIGFFECIDDQEAAGCLLDQASRWLGEQQIKVIHGPVNFGSRHQWWGLMIKSSSMPNYGNNYHPAYYRALIENYGFVLNYQQLTYSIKQTGAQPILFERLRSHFEADSRYAFKAMDTSRPVEMAAQFQQLYHKICVVQDGLPALNLNQVLTLMHKLGDMLDPRLIWFGYFNGEPIAFFVAIPELNQLIMQHVGGKINFIDRFKLARLRWLKQYEKAYGLYCGVLPAFQKRAVALGLIANIQDAWANRLKIPYKSIELNWIGDYNPRMLKLMKLLDAEVTKIHHTYRLWI